MRRVVLCGAVLCAFAIGTATAQPVTKEEKAARAKQIQVQIAELRKQFPALYKQIESLNEVMNLRKQIAELQKQIEGLNEVKDLRKQIAELNKKIAELDDELIVLSDPLMNSQGKLEK